MVKDVKPDSPVYVVDAGTLDSLPDDLREAFEELFSAKERQEAKELEERERAYQQAQADRILSHGGWEEVECRSSVLLSDAAVGREPIHCNEISEASTDTPPTLDQFYVDLYGARLFAADGSGPSGDANILVNHRDREHPYQLYKSYRDFVEGTREETSYIYMGGFWVPPSGYLTSVANAMVTIGGFCVDIDRAEDDKGNFFGADWFVDSLLECVDSQPEMRPNYILLTGTGVQLWYVFGNQIKLLSKKSPRRAKYNELLKLLYRWFDDRLRKNLFKVDTACAHINCALRAPGSPAKRHYPTRLFAFGGSRRGMVDPLALSSFLGGHLMPYDVEDWDQEQYERIKEEARRAGEGRSAPASEKQLAYIDKLHRMGCLPEEAWSKASSEGGMTIAEADAAIKAGEVAFTSHSQWVEDQGYIKTSAGHVLKRKARDRGLYDYTLARIPEETPAGSRYWSLFGLAGVAYNCCVPKREVENDMLALLDTGWAARQGHDGKPLGKDDVKAALRGYNALGCLRTREQLEAHLKWSYAPPAKRNGRSRVEHLWGDWFDEDGDRRLNTAKASRMYVLGSSDRPLAKRRREESIERMASFLADHPDASKRRCCEELGMSRTTVTKYWQEACDSVGIEDKRSGNHSPL